MIKVICLDGPFAGAVRIFEGTRAIDDLEKWILGEATNPSELFGSFVMYGWRWEVDYSKATDEEFLKWFAAEIMARILRALRNGLPVKFFNKIYRLSKDEDLLKVGQEIEGAIASSKKIIFLISDDENGLVIGVKGFEQ